MAKHTNNRYGHKVNAIQKAKPVKPTVTADASRVRAYATGSAEYNKYRQEQIDKGGKIKQRREWEKDRAKKDKAKG